MKNSQNSLTEVTFLILLALSSPKHGYGIIQEIEEWTDGRVLLAAGTMYSALENLLKKKWIESTGEEKGRRKFYQLTSAGKEILAEDYQRMQLNIALYQKYCNQKEGKEDA